MQERTTTVIGVASYVVGEVRGDGDVVLRGTLDGSLTTSGRVVVEGTAEVQGPLHADVIEVHGRIVGDVLARSELQLHATGQVLGDIRTGRLRVDDGGVFHGEVEILDATPDGAGPAPAAVPPEPPPTGDPDDEEQLPPPRDSSELQQAETRARRGLLPAQRDEPTPSITFEDLAVASLSDEPSRPKPAPRPDDAPPARPLDDLGIDAPDPNDDAPPGRR